MDKYIKPKCFDIDHNSPNAEKEWKHWRKIFHNFLDIIEYTEDSDKLKILESNVSSDIYGLIEECPTFEEALSLLDKLYVPKKTIPMFMWEPNEDLKKTRKETFIKETLPYFMKRFDNIVKENGGYLANKKLSWADFMFAGLTEYISYAVGVEDVTKDYENLKALRDKIFSLPQITKYLAKRPQTPF